MSRFGPFHFQKYDSCWVHLRTWPVRESTQWLSRFIGYVKIILVYNLCLLIEGVISPTEDRIERGWPERMREHSYQRACKRINKDSDDMCWYLEITRSHHSMGGNVGPRLEANEADVPENVDIYYVIRQWKRVLNFHEQSTSRMSKDLRSGAGARVMSSLEGCRTGRLQRTDESFGSHCTRPMFSIRSIFSTM
jgi:hypothetical protein